MINSQLAIINLKFKKLSIYQPLMTL